MKFTVKRLNWNRGNNNLASFNLLNKNRTRCCLGFLGKTCGIPDEELRGASYPDEIPSTNWPVELSNKNVVSDLNSDINNSYVFNNSHAIAVTNDDSNISDSVREKILTKQFAAIGIEVTFED